MGSITQPLPSSYLIFRAPSEGDGKCWMDALELALRCSSLLMRSMRDDQSGLTGERKMNDSEIENKHFKHEGGSRSDLKDDVCGCRVFFFHSKMTKSLQPIQD